MNELYIKSYTDEDVNFLVGINGSGKSIFLNELALYHRENGKNIICIANTIYDKFNIRNTKNSHILKNRIGNVVAKKTFYDLFKILERKDSKTFYNISLLLNYLKFSTIIEFEIIGLTSNLEEIIKPDFYRSSKTEEVLRFLRDYKFEINKLNDRENLILDFTIMPDYNSSGHSIFNLFFNFMKFENLLKRLKVLKEINIYLNKEGKKISINEASSGELTMISILIFISNNIDDNTVILIDEPENSLHPKWQIEYVRQLTELFYFYQPKIIIATHSPLLINGAELNNSNVNIFKALEFKNFVKEDKDLKNVEEIYEEYFNVVTPQNRFISEYVIDEFNNLINKKITIIDFEIFIESLIKNSFDEVQKNALEGILEIAKNEI